MAEKVVFLTGANGFLGAELLHRYLEREPGTSVICLVRGTSAQQAHERAIQALDLCRNRSSRTVQMQNERLLIVNGDVTHARFGLSPLVYSLLQRRTTHILHAAASTRFDLSLEEARRINVGGTLEVLRFARGCDNLDRLGYVSTAYVAGDREGIVREGELNVGQGFLNAYEQSKMEAEALIHEAMATGLPRAMIFRPSIIMGDSRDGRTTTFKMLYCPMRLYSLGVIKEIPGKPWVRLDVVPINYAADAIHHLFGNDSAIGQVFHLVAGPERSMSLQALVERVAEVFNTRLQLRGISRRLSTPKIVIDDDGRRFLDQAIASTPMGQVRSMLEMFRFFVPYTQKDKMFDDQNARRVLAVAEIEALPFASYIHRILAYCLETSWGRRPQEREMLDAEVWIEERFEKVFSS